MLAKPIGVLRAVVDAMGIATLHPSYELTKRASKRDHSPRYMALDLGALRSTAEFMRQGIVRSAEINIYVRYRNGDLSRLDKSLRAFVENPDFPMLDVPPQIELTEVP